MTEKPLIMHIMSRNITEQREKKIRDSLEQADKAQEEAEKRKK